MDPLYLSMEMCCCEDQMKITGLTVSQARSDFDDEFTRIDLKPIFKAVAALT